MRQSHNGPTIGRWTVLFCIVLVWPVFGQTPISPTPESAGPSQRRLHAIHVFAPDSGSKQILSRWVKRLTEKFERRVKLPTPHNKRQLRIVVRDDAEIPSASCSQQFRFGEVQQTVILQHIDRVDRETSDAALCKALVMAHMNVIWDSLESPGSYSEWIEKTVPERLPKWFCSGLARSFHSHTRLADGDRVAMALRKDALPGLNAFLEKVATPERDSLEEARLLESMGTELTEWLLSFPDQGRTVHALLKHVSGATKLDAEWMADIVPACRTAQDVQSAWLEWVRQHDLRILSPGTTDMRDMEQLRVLLTEVSDDNFEATRFGDPPPLHVSELIPFREHPAMAGFAAIRSHQVKFLALGRSKAFAEVVESYCDFLNALASPEKEANLHELYSQTMRKNDRLRRRIEKDEQAERP